MAALVLAALAVLPSPAPAPSGPRRLLALLPAVGLALLGAVGFAFGLRALGGLDEVDRRRLERVPFPGRDFLFRPRSR
jgi:hypothetical protein